MDEQIQQHIIDDDRRLFKMEQELESVNKKLTELETSISDLVVAWKTASNIVASVKWLAGVATAIIAVVSFIKLGSWRG